MTDETRPEGTEPEVGASVVEATPETSVEDTAPEEEQKPRLNQTVEMRDVGPCKKHIKVTIDREDINQRFDRKFSELVVDANVAGFRPGKAPRKIIERRFQKDVSEQVKTELLLESLEQLAEEHEVAPLTAPNISPRKIEIPKDGPLVYEFEVEVRPEFDLPNYKGLRLRRPVRPITDDDVLQQERRILAPYGQLVPKPEGNAQIGDYLVADLTNRLGDQVIGTLKEVTIRIDPVLALKDGVAEDFGEKVKGANAGETRVIDIKLSDAVAIPELRGKTILEIGCGKGEFLALMCELGDCRGIGIDPSYQPSRTPATVAHRLRFINDLYSEKYADLEADAILCRHTLEHIGATLQFIRMIRRAIGDRRHMLVLFELPDVTRVLKEAAFWDVYYEHCSYFSPGSLARLFRRAGFDLLELRRDYADQYLLLAGRPSPQPTQPRLPLEDDLQQMQQLAADFARQVQSSIKGWKEMITAAHARGKKVVLWSALSKAVAFLTTTKVGQAVEYAVDINPRRQGRFLPVTGQQIMPPQFLRDYQPDYVILMNPIYVPEVRAELDRLSVPAKVLAVGADEPALDG